MSNTQKKQAKRKARRKATPQTSIARTLGLSPEEALKAVRELRALKLVSLDGKGRLILSEESLISMAMYEKTRVFVPPNEL